MRDIILTVLVLVTPLLFGCATVRGMGKDMESAGKWMQRNVSSDQQSATSQSSSERLAVTSHQKRFEK